MPDRFLPIVAESPGVTSACSLVAAGAVAATLAELPALRDRPGDPHGPAVPPRFLRHADEQTVVGLAAVLRAMGDPSLSGQCYDDWGVVAAPVFPGRLGGAATFTKYREGGPAAISPHIIPQHSLHSVAGAISIAVGLHGPNFGIGGGPEALGEGLAVALSLVGDAALPGLWLVLTQWTPEPVPDGRGSTLTETVCWGIALGLRKDGESGATLQMTLGTSDPGTGAGAGGGFESRGTDCCRIVEDQEALPGLAHWLMSAPLGRQTAPWSFGLPWGGRVELVQQQQHYQRVKAA